jgi:hypothetical protein
MDGKLDAEFGEFLPYRSGCRCRKGYATPEGIFKDIYTPYSAPLGSLNSAGIAFLKKLVRVARHSEFNHGSPPIYLFLFVP